jgi:hypothetical protein
VLAATLGRPGARYSVAGQVPGGRPAGAADQAGAGQAAQAERRPATPPVHVDPGADPRQLRFEFPPRTREMARELIRRELEVHLPTANPGRQLRRLGPCLQRPPRRA